MLYKSPSLTIIRPLLLSPHSPNVDLVRPAPSLASGFDMRAEDAAEYASRSSMHALLVVFVNNLRETIMTDAEFLRKLKASKIVDEIWDQFDEDKDGLINSDELQELIKEVMAWDENGKGDAPTPEEAQRFLQHMDTDGNGVLDKDEFTTFVVNTLGMKVDLRISFAQRSAMHAKLMVFATNISERTYGRT